MPGIKTPNFEITLGNVDFSSRGYKSRIRLIEVDQQSDGASSFKLQLDDRDDLFAKGKAKINEGDECVIRLGYAETGLEQVIHAYVTGVNSVRREYSRKIYEVTGFDGLHALTRGRKRRSWENIKDSDIARIIADECHLGTDEIEDSKIVQPFVVQNNQNDLNFLYDRARRIGFEVKVVEKNLVFKKADKTVSTAVTLRYDHSKADYSTSILQRCNFDATTMNVVKKVVVRGYNPDTAKPIIASSENVQAMGGKLATERVQSYNDLDSTIQISDTPIYSEEEAERLAESVLNQRADNFLTGRGRCEGNAKLTCGKTVKICDIGDEMEGDYYITSCKHTISAGSGNGFGYFTDFSISRSSR